MAAITAQMVKDLREKTGAGMMDCKTALAETGGDIEAAVDWLRKKGLAKAAKKSGRVAADGLVAIATSEKAGAVIELNSETDFVARNDQFQDLARGIADAALATATEDVAAVSAAKLGGVAVSDAITSAIATVGENMTLRRVGYLSVGAGVVASYMHAQVADGLGRIGVLVALESTAPAAALMAFGRDLAKHVAASSPLAVDPAGLDPALVARERAILAEKHAEKPANVVERIIESGLKTYYREVALIDQAYVHDDAKTVAMALRDFQKNVGAPVKIAGFRRFAIGEGIEKETSDFAAEVAAAVKPQG